MSAHGRALAGTAVGAATVVLLAGGTPATAAPPTPSGCTFATGRTTCVTVTHASRQSPPMTGTGPSDGSLPARWCLQNWGPQFLYYGTANAVFYQVVTTTTTTVRKGAPSGRGPVISTTTTEAAGDPVYVSGLVDCSTGPF